MTVLNFFTDYLDQLASRIITIGCSHTILIRFRQNLTGTVECPGCTAPIIFQSTYKAVFYIVGIGDTGKESPGFTIGKQSILFLADCVT